MVKSVLKIFVLMIAVIGGGIAGSFVKNMSQDGSQPASHGDAHSSDEGDGKTDSQGKKGDKKDSNAKDMKLSGTEYLKFKRQFVIPVMEEKKIKSLVIMNLNLELNENAPSQSSVLEPKLRDAFMRDLLSLSNEGVFGGELTDPDNFDILRETLLGTARRILDGGVNDVLILDLAKRDV